jgi:hypothetical protein
MIAPDIVKELLLYFARFVKKEVREKSFRMPRDSRPPGYDELRADLMALDEQRALPDVDLFIFTISWDKLSDSIKSQHHRLLFVEYGDVKLTRTTGQVYNDTRLSISIGSNLNTANNDLISEAIKMQRNLDLLNIILGHMQKDNKICGLVKTLEMPASVMPLDPKDFFGNGGWLAMFSRQDLVLV